MKYHCTAWLKNQEVDVTLLLVLLNIYMTGYFYPHVHTCSDVYVIRGQDGVVHMVLMWTVSNNSRVTTYPVPPVCTALNSSMIN